MVALWIHNSRSIARSDSPLRGVRRAVMVEGMSIRDAARTFGLHRDTVRRTLAYSVPPWYRRKTPPRRPKLEPYNGVIDRILKDDLRSPGNSDTLPNASTSGSGMSMSRVNYCCRNVLPHPNGYSMKVVTSVMLSKIGEAGEGAIAGYGGLSCC